MKLLTIGTLLTVGIFNEIFAQSNINGDYCDRIQNLYDSITENVADRFEVISSYNLSRVPGELVYYRSLTTGLTVGIGRVKVPGMFLEITIRTEPTSDNGEPHTLEHMAFFGSKMGPFTRYLTTWAQRTGVYFNARAGQRRTTYVVHSVDANSLFKYMMVSMDHVFRPLLKDDVFLTEIHHVDGNGTDKGTVYNEMLAVYSSRNRLERIAFMRSIFPQNNGHHWVSGGSPEALRKLSLESIRKFHKKYYVPQNALLTLTGPINTEQALRAIIGVEDAVFLNKELTFDYRCSAQNPTNENLPANTATGTTAAEQPQTVPSPAVNPLVQGVRLTSEGSVEQAFAQNDNRLPPSPNTIRADWRERFPPLPKPLYSSFMEPFNSTQIVEVYIPAESSSSGTVMIGISTKLPRTGLIRTAIDVLNVALTSDRSPVSEWVKANKFVGPVLFETSSYDRYVTLVRITGTKNEEMYEAYKQFFGVLQNMYRTKLDKSMIATTLDGVTERKKRVVGDFINAFSAIAPIDFTLFGGNGSFIAEELNFEGYMQELYRWTIDQWNEFFRKVYLDDNHRAVFAKGSKELSVQLREQDKQRTIRQRNSMTVAQRKARDDQLAIVRDNNEAPVPVEYLPKVEPIDVNGLSTLIPDVPYSFTPGWNKRFANAEPLESAAQFQRLTDEQGAQQLDLPIVFMEDPFGSLVISITTENVDVPIEKLYLLRALVDTFFNVGYTVNGFNMTADESIKALRLFSSRGFSLGLGGVSQYSVNLTVAGPSKAYDLMVQWIEAFYFGVNYDIVSLKKALEPRLKNLQSRSKDLFNQIGSISNIMTRIHDSAMMLADDSIAEKMIERFLRELAQDPARTINELLMVRQRVLVSPRTRIFVSGPLREQASIVQPWKRFSDRIEREFGSYEKFTQLVAGSPPVPGSPARPNRAGVSPIQFGKTTFIVPFNSIESGQAILMVQGPKNLTNTEFTNLMTYLKFITPLTQPILRYIRAAGLGYSLNFDFSRETGTLTFRILRSSNPAAAYELARTIVLEYYTGARQYSEEESIMASNAASTRVAVEFSSRDQVVTSRQRELFLGGGSGRTVTFEENLRKPVAAEKQLTAAQMGEFARQWIIPLFMESRATTVLACASNLVDDQVRRLQSPYIVGNDTVPGHTARVVSYDEIFNIYTTDIFGIKPRSGR